MELRHLRYFVAVAEEKSITVAATRRLRTAQPSLSRQLRELVFGVGEQVETAALDLLLQVRAGVGVALEAVLEALLERAAQLLTSTELPVKSVAAQVGYASRSSFTRAFVATYGAAPKTFRRDGTLPLAA